MLDASVSGWPFMRIVQPLSAIFGSTPMWTSASVSTFTVFTSAPSPESPSPLSWRHCWSFFSSILEPPFQHVASEFTESEPMVTVATAVGLSQADRTSRPADTAPRTANPRRVAGLN